MSGIAGLSLANLALAGAMLATQLGARRRLLQATARPGETQHALLRRILRDNAATAFGRHHGFAAIDGYAAFRDRVPVATYEDLRAEVEAQERTGAARLTRARPVMYARTSGTTGAPKYVPVPAAAIAGLKRAQRIFAHSQYTGSGIHGGRILAVGSPAVEGHLGGGAPYGSTTGLIYQSMPRLIRGKYVLPAELFGIADYDAKYLAIAALGLAEGNVTGLAAANPSTFLKLLGVIEAEWDRLVDGIAVGRLNFGGRLSEAQAAAFQRRFRPAPARARELAAIRRPGRAVRFADIWPDLQGVVTWTGGSCGLALNALADKWPAGTRIIEAGYAASELWGSINLDAGRGLCVPSIQDNFFEFVERAGREAGRLDFLTVEQLEEGRQYYVIVTTPGGLYRYDMNDIVEVTGRVNAVPAIAFVQKGKGVTNITGEKLAESQLLDAVEAAGIETSFFVAVADEQAAAYRLFLEPGTANGAGTDRLAAEIDRRLGELNIEYAEKRKSGRLKPLDLVPLAPGTAEAYKRHCVAAGQREAQFKVLHLQYARDCAFDFAGHRAAGR